MVTIGGCDLYLRAHRDIDSALVEHMDLLCPLNGELPPAPYGRYLPVISCQLRDRGGVPIEWPGFIHTIARLLRKGNKIMAWCMGGHGRTGTFGASLIAIMEPDTEDPIAAIRSRWCDEAVESLEQAKGIYSLRAQPVPDEYVEEFTPKPVMFRIPAGVETDWWRKPSNRVGRSQSQQDLPWWMQDPREYEHFSSHGGPVRSPLSGPDSTKTYNPTEQEKKK